MPHLNVEIKAHCADPERVRAILHANNADCRGLDHQIDTYFHVPNGRMKIREGNIEKALIHYQRNNQQGPKDSQVTLFKSPDTEALKQVLTAGLGVLVVVDKRREIFFIGNVKFHVDDVQSLGSFVEIEAIDADGTLGRDELLRQCEQYMSDLGIHQDDLVTCSYSDMILERGVGATHGSSI